MKDSYKIIWWAVVFVIGMSLQVAHADEWGGADKEQHKLYSGIGTVALYPVARSFDVEYPKATAAGLMFTVGVVKEFIDPLGNNPTPTSPKDIGANLIGITAAVGLLYGGEWLEENYGFNPFYFRWN